MKMTYTPKSKRGITKSKGQQWMAIASKKCMGLMGDEYKNCIASQMKELKQAHREELIERIEGITGSLKSVPWSQVSTKDLNKLLGALRSEQS